MSARAVIFDLDGTLVNTLGDIAAAMNHALGLAGLPTHPQEAYPKWIGGGLDKACGLAAGTEDPAQIDWLVATFREYYAAHMVERAVAYEGVHALLSALARRDVPLAVLTNKKEASAVETVRCMFPEVPFATVIGAVEGRPLKPDAEVAHQTCRVLGVPSGSALMVGDTEYDILTGHNAGMTSVGVTWGFGSAEAIASAEPHHLIDAPDALLELI